MPVAPALSAGQLPALPDRDADRAAEEEHPIPTQPNDLWGAASRYLLACDALETTPSAAVKIEALDLISSDYFSPHEPGIFRYTYLEADGRFSKDRTVAEYAAEI